MVECVILLMHFISIRFFSQISVFVSVSLQFSPKWWRGVAAEMNCSMKYSQKSVGEWSGCSGNLNSGVVAINK